MRKNQQQHAELTYVRAYLVIKCDLEVNLLKKNKMKMKKLFLGFLVICVVVAALADAPTNDEERRVGNEKTD